MKKSDQLVDEAADNGEQAGSLRRLAVDSLNGRAVSNCDGSVTVILKGRGLAPKQVTMYPLQWVVLSDCVGELVYAMKDAGLLSR